MPSVTNKLNDVLESDPSKVAGWLVAVLGGVAGFLATLTPQLDEANGWADAGLIVFMAALPRFATALAALKAFKPSTVTQLTTEAYINGVDAGVSNEQAKAKKKKAGKTPAPAPSSEKPRVKKRQAGKKKNGQVPPPQTTPAS